MAQNLQDALRNRRSHYSLSPASPISDEAIKDIIDFAVTHVPSAFNSQSTRIVLLLGENHRRLWDITKDTLRPLVPAKAFPATEAKIDGSFRNGHGTILFFEDRAIVEQLQAAYPLYADRFPTWAQHTSAMHQLAIWAMLEDAGLGVSLQHYNPLIDEAVNREWQLSSQWELIAQMPFGTSTAQSGEKTFTSLEERVKVFG